MDHSNANDSKVSHSRPRALRALVFGGLLPVIIFTVIEEYFGTVWGLIAGMIFGIGEIAYEKLRANKVDTITWIGNGLLLGLGAIALVTSEGIWFKLQPAILEGSTVILLLGSVMIGKPLLAVLAEKQKVFDSVLPEIRKLLYASFRTLTIRLALFFAIHTGLATWAALHWSTRAWALLKGVGFTVSFIAYLFVEVLWVRRKIGRFAMAMRQSQGTQWRS
ncbi:MAG: septation protein IspZ [Deltaproteobacteria bacterium]|nr:septation protein IspZ [Deltaproteobacteria bacterium]